MSTGAADAQIDRQARVEAEHRLHHRDADFAVRAQRDLEAGQVAFGRGPRNQHVNEVLRHRDHCLYVGPRQRLETRSTGPAPPHESTRFVIPHASANMPPGRFDGTLLPYEALRRVRVHRVDIRMTIERMIYEPREPSVRKAGHESRQPFRQ